jgi:hypothetical protein
LLAPLWLTTSVSPSLRREKTKPVGLSFSSRSAILKSLPAGAAAPAASHDAPPVEGFAVSAETSSLPARPGLIAISPWTLRHLPTKTGRRRPDAFKKGGAVAHEFAEIEILFVPRFALAEARDPVAIVRVVVLVPREALAPARIEPLERIRIISRDLRIRLRQRRIGADRLLSRGCRPGAIKRGRGPGDRAPVGHSLNCDESGEKQRSPQQLVHDPPSPRHEAMAPDDGASTL